MTGAPLIGRRRCPPIHRRESVMDVNEAGAACDRLASIYSRPGLEAADIKQELLMKFLEVEPTGASDAYIKKCLKNRAIDLIRGEVRRERRIDRSVDVSRSAHSGKPQSEVSKNWSVFFKSLNDHEIIVARMLMASAIEDSSAEDFRHSAIAEVLGVSGTTVGRIVKSIRLKAGIILAVEGGRGKRQVAAS